MGAGRSVQGYRVINVQPGSPLEEGGLQSYLDFILSVNAVTLRGGNDFAAFVNLHVGERLNLQVFNILTQEVREEVVVPRQEWGGAGLLGGTVRFEEWSSESGSGLKVLSVLPGSPAEVAGLVALQDHILGTDTVSLTHLDQLASLVHRFQELPIYVYSSTEHRVRTVTLRLKPGEQLGIDAGQGAVHRLGKEEGPAPIQEAKVEGPPPSLSSAPIPALLVSRDPRVQQEARKTTERVLTNPFGTS